VDGAAAHAPITPARALAKSSALDHSLDEQRIEILRLLERGSTTRAGKALPRADVDDSKLDVTVAAALHRTAEDGIHPLDILEPDATLRNEHFGDSEVEIELLEPLLLQHRILELIEIGKTQLYDDAAELAIVSGRLFLAAQELADLFVANLADPLELLSRQVPAPEQEETDVLLAIGFRAGTRTLGELLSRHVAIHDGHASKEILVELRHERRSPGVETVEFVENVR
jgi:hypothetical protein